MAKGGKKAPKRYELPPEKFIVVVNPWGSPTNKLFINNVGVWFEHMLHEEYPDTQVEAIYTQGTHTNIIVELPAHVDISQYLGAHAYARFLTPPWNNSLHVAYMYEYAYELFDDPTRRGWKALYPTYTSIPPNFPVKKEGYPMPEPAPPPTRDVPYARKPVVDYTDASASSTSMASKQTETSSKVWDDDAARLLQSLIEPDIKPDIKPFLEVKGEPQDEKYTPSAELIAAVATKIDPYHDDHKPSPELISALPTKKEEPAYEPSPELITAISAKRESASELIATLPAKVEPGDDANTSTPLTKQEPAYEPSPELIAAISAKREAGNDEYQSSPELIAAFSTKVEGPGDSTSTASPQLRAHGLSVKREWESGRGDEGAQVDTRKRQKQEE